MPPNLVGSDAGLVSALHTLPQYPVETLVYRLKQTFRTSISAFSTIKHYLSLAAFFTYWSYSPIRNQATYHRQSTFQYNYTPLNKMSDRDSTEGFQKSRLVGW